MVELYYSQYSLEEREGGRLRWQDFESILKEAFISKVGNNHRFVYKPPYHDDGCALERMGFVTLDQSSFPVTKLNLTPFKLFGKLRVPSSLTTGCMF
jgi:hypothetical protein